MKEFVCAWVRLPFLKFLTWQWFVLLPYTYLCSFPSICKISDFILVFLLVFDMASTTRSFWGFPVLIVVRKTPNIYMGGTLTFLKLVWQVSHTCGVCLVSDGILTHCDAGLVITCQRLWPQNLTEAPFVYFHYYILLLYEKAALLPHCQKIFSLRSWYLSCKYNFNHLGVLAGSTCYLTDPVFLQAVDF